MIISQENIEEFQKPEQHPNERAAGEFYDYAEEQQDPKAQEFYSRIGTEVAQDNFDGAQRNLELNVDWDDNLRNMAAEANRLDQERRGDKPLGFRVTKEMILAQAAEFFSSGEIQDKKAALEIESLVSGTERPGAESLDEILNYVEGILLSKNEAIIRKGGANKIDLDILFEKRAQRDALMREKLTRIEKKENSASAEQLGKDRELNESLQREQEARDQKELAEIRKGLEIEEPAEERLRKFENFQEHKQTAEKIVRALRDIHNIFESGNNTSDARMLIEVTLEGIIGEGKEDLLKGLGSTGEVDLTTEVEILGVGENDKKDYQTLREAQSMLIGGASVEAVVSFIEEELGVEYGVQRVNFSEIDNIKQIDANISPVETDDVRLKGKIKSVLTDGYHIPDVPVFGKQGNIINTVNKDVGAKPLVEVYRVS